MIRMIREMCHSRIRNAFSFLWKGCRLRFLRRTFEAEVPTVRMTHFLAVCNDLNLIGPVREVNNTSMMRDTVIYLVEAWATNLKFIHIALTTQRLKGFLHNQLRWSYLWWSCTVFQMMNALEGIHSPHFRMDCCQFLY